MTHAAATGIRRFSWQWLAVGLLFASSLLLVSPDLMPTLNDLNPHDETKYIDSGRSLVRGYTREFEWSPLSSVVYAPIYLAVQHSPDWFSWMAALGRGVLFSLLWFSFYHLGRQFDRFFPRWLLPCLMLAGVSLTGILRNPSDALFAAMSALAMARVVAYNNKPDIKQLWLGSAYLGLAALSRNDGLFLYPVFLVASVYLALRRERTVKLIAACVVPAVALVIGYVVVRGLPQGDFSLGTGYRGYTAYTWSVGSNFRLNPQDVTALIGSDDENSRSLARVILRHPDVFTRQVKHNLSSLPDVLLSAYGQRLAPPLFYLALVGALALYRRRAWFQLGLLLIWPLHSALYLAFYLRAGFVLLEQSAVLVLAALGADFLCRELVDLGRQALWSAPLLGLAVFGFVDDKLAIAVGGVVPLLALWVWWFAQRTSHDVAYPATLGLLVLLLAGVILRDGYSFPNYPEIGRTPMDRAVQFLLERLPQGSGVYAYVPLPALAARMSHVERADLAAPLGQGSSLCEVLLARQVRALYVTPEMISQLPDFWELIVASEGSCIDRALVADPGSIQVFLVSD